MFFSYKQRSRVYINNFNLNLRPEPNKGDQNLWWGIPRTGELLHYNLHAMLPSTMVTLIRTGF